MPRFTFPIPGRRQKQQPVSTASPQQIGGSGGPGLTKAQRILGLTDISVDAHSGANWDAHSNTGIGTNASASETPYAETRSIGAGEHTYQTPDVEVGTIEVELDLDDEESGIMPLALDRKLSNARHQSIADFHDAVSDASSVRRRQSSSTINSFYDKSKQPLRISQQTSSSAMAMGLLNKQPHGVLFNVTDASSPTSSRDDGSMRKKKPARLDLSHLLPKVTRQSMLTPLRPTVLGPDMITKSPSLMSEPGDSLQSPQQPDRQRSFRKNLRSLSSRKTKENLRMDSIERRRSETIHSLYDHYEQQSLYKDALAEVQEEEVEVPLVLSPEMQDMATSPSAHSLHTPYSTSTGISGTHSKTSSAYTRNESMPATPLTAVMTPDLHAPAPRFSSADCAESISSRHTRTSKASKRTTHSGFDMDLKKISVLSLSSDSEEDPLEDDTRKTSANSSVFNIDDGPGTPPKTKLPPVPTRARRSESTILQTAKMVEVLGPVKPRKETRPYTASLFPKVPQQVQQPMQTRRSSEAASQTSSRPPVINSRSSSLHPGTAKRKPARTNLRQPSMPHHTIDSVASGTSQVGEHTTWTREQLEGYGPSPGSKAKAMAHPTSSSSSNDLRTSSIATVSGFTVYESKAARPMPAEMDALAPSRKFRPTQEVGSTTHLSISVASVSDQPTPPVSPASSEFNRHSPNTSTLKESTDGSSVEVTPVRASERDAASSCNGSSPLSKYTTPSPNSTSSRFMAVTRQEEMLLAALRLKRARMRESIIAEFETEERDRVIDAFPSVPGAMDTAETSSLNRQQLDKVSSHRRQHSSISTLSGFEASLAPRPQQKAGTRQHAAGRSSSVQSHRVPKARSVSGSHNRDVSPMFSAQGGSDLALDSFPIPERSSMLAPQHHQATKQWSFESGFTAASSQSRLTDTHDGSPPTAGLMPPTRQDKPLRGDQFYRETRGRQLARSQSAMGSYPTNIASPSTFMSDPRKKAARISAVGGPPGRVGVEMGLWGDDG
ncbi:hypothetical protein MCOR25_000215 [Pyricularia grisea]|uniref:Uncharacterized protein n=1 Tax=Pyricularia grisea TaxID=148305 RepID=A0A6P8BJQ9_PYRGI|nr:uncharacterized protein PgNI_02297 [Pyricularia grisea]KAI6383295.1 hypothetical protein MCOR25_000215 [Pyricularia grisea]TLD17023.1 hypothetical protein PgNI_02297 [Pyricularia grisea]